EQHLIVGGVGDRAARGQRRRPRATPAAQNAVDRVTMDKRAAPTATGGEALGQHARDCVEIFAGQRAEGPCAAQAIIKLRLRPILRGASREVRLGYDAERPLRKDEAINPPAPYAVDERCALDEVATR